MRTLLRDEKGTALVAALFFITALALTATVIVWVTGSERRVAQNEFSHVRSFYASDAGAEQSINFITMLDFAPIPWVDGGDYFIKDDSTETAMHADHKYQAEVKHKLDNNGNPIPARPARGRGYDASVWQEVEYVVDSFGMSASESETRIEVHTARLFRATQTY